MTVSVFILIVVLSGIAWFCICCCKRYMVCVSLFDGGYAKTAHSCQVLSPVLSSEHWPLFRPERSFLRLFLYRCPLVEERSVHLWLWALLHFEELSQCGSIFHIKREFLLKCWERVYCRSLWSPTESFRYSTLRKRRQALKAAGVGVF